MATRKLNEFGEVSGLTIVSKETIINIMTYLFVPIVLLWQVFMEQSNPYNIAIICVFVALGFLFQGVKEMVGGNKLKLNYCMLFAYLFAIAFNYSLYLVCIVG